MLTREALDFYGDVLGGLEALGKLLSEALVK